MDVQLSKKAKLIIGVAAVILIAPLYLASNPGMEKIIKSQWDRADDAKTPVNLYRAMVFYNATYREAKMEELAKEWLKHYGGDETEKELGQRYMSWGELRERTFPFDPETNPRPPQRGEDYRPTPHPLTADVLNMWALHLENNHQLQMAVHLYNCVDDEKYATQWGIQRDPEAVKTAHGGVIRNGSGSRSF